MSTPESAVRVGRKSLGSPAQTGAVCRPNNSRIRANSVLRQVAICLKRFTFNLDHRLNVKRPPDLWLLPRFATLPESKVARSALAVNVIWPFSHARRPLATESVARNRESDVSY